MQERKPRKGDLVELDIERLGPKGHGRGRFGEFTFDVRGAVPGSRVRAAVFRRRKNRVDAVIDELLAPSPVACAPRCAHFASCGGCAFQNLEYAAQLEHLAQALGETLAPAEIPDVAPIVACAQPWNYRNKMDFTFGNKRWIEADEPPDAPNGFAVGLHVAGRFDKILDVRSCEIAFVEANAILASVRELAVAAGLSAWDVREHRGLLRHLVLRKGFATGEIMADLVTTEEAPDAIEPLVARLLERHPGLTTVVQHTNDGVALVAGGVETVRHGSGVIHEELAGLSFRISAASFFQTNTAQAEELVRIVREEALVVPGARVFDLYCGSGLFSLALAKQGARVTGFELVPSAIDDARLNAGRNGIDAVRFVAGDLVETLAAETETPDVCVVDPPRPGVHPRVLAMLTALAPERIVYVSCNPKSAVEDLIVLRAGGYRVERARPVDLFPHTPHLECVFTLTRATATASGGSSMAGPSVES